IFCCQRTPPAGNCDTASRGGHEAVSFQMAVRGELYWPFVVSLSNHERRIMNYKLIASREPSNPLNF
ncbi:MAG TPA: hypothetical protein PLX58_09480, partial [Smithellaceae bacterium]|nr:hypothetical protein [Smithellaceae bacterium]HQF85190.1 hypothetical protein [Smithellaceae bacterium]HQG81381.1 hypothetical protein [Smithellaceae bacterium]